MKQGHLAKWPQVGSRRGEGGVASLCHIADPDLGPELGGKHQLRMRPPHLTAHQVLQPPT